MRYHLFKRVIILELMEKHKYTETRAVKLLNKHPNYLKRVWQQVSPPDHIAKILAGLERMEKES